MAIVSLPPVPVQPPAHVWNIPSDDRMSLGTAEQLNDLAAFYESRQDVAPWWRSLEDEANASDYDALAGRAAEEMEAEAMTSHEPTRFMFGADDAAAGTDYAWDAPFDLADAPLPL